MCVCVCVWFYSLILPPAPPSLFDLFLLECLCFFLSPFYYLIMRRLLPFSCCDMFKCIIIQFCCYYALPPFISLSPLVSLFVSSRLLPSPPLSSSSFYLLSSLSFSLSPTPCSFISVSSCSPVLLTLDCRIELVYGVVDQIINKLLASH